MAGPCQEAGGLRQQRRLADGGVAADQQHRAADKAAAGDAIELSHAGGEARGLVALAGQCLQRELTALAPGADRGRHRGRAGVLFDQRVPLVARFALALPAAIRGAAVLTNEGRKCVLGHGGVTSSFSAVALRISHRARPQPSSPGSTGRSSISRGGSSQSAAGYWITRWRLSSGSPKSETRWRVMTRRQIAISRSATSPKRTARPNRAPLSSAARRSTFRPAPG